MRSSLHDDADGPETPFNREMDRPIRDRIIGVDQGRMWKFPADVLRYFFAYLLNELEPATPIERLRLIADEMEREGA